MDGVSYSTVTWLKVTFFLSLHHRLPRYSCTNTLGEALSVNIIFLLIRIITRRLHPAIVFASQVAALLLVVQNYKCLIPL